MARKMMRFTQQKSVMRQIYCATMQHSLYFRFQMEAQFQIWTFYAQRGQGAKGVSKKVGSKRAIRRHFLT